MLPSGSSYGLKENVIVGHLIPAGTGQRCFRDIVVGSKTELAKLRAEIAGDGKGPLVGV